MLRVRELRVTYAATDRPLPLQRIAGPTDAVTLLRDRLADEAVEVTLVLLLDTKHRCLGVNEVGRGTVDQCPVAARDVFKVALLANAAAVIVGHNHPSGDPSPSAADLAMHRRLLQAGQIMGVELLDFVIVGDPDVYSFQRMGLQ